MSQKNIILCGDTHGEWDKLAMTCAIHKSKTVLVIGDVGLGFARHKDLKPWPQNLWFFRGNHDNPATCQKHPNFVGDYGMWRGLFVVGGAKSVDADRRTPGLDWWADEEMNREDLEMMLESYTAAQPEIVVTHEAPFRLHTLLAESARLRDPRTAQWGTPRGSPTAFALDDMLNIHTPKLWVFGHWHVNLSVRARGTTFRCLDCHETLDLDSI